MSDRDPVESEALRWLRFSGEDLDIAERLLNSSPPAPRHVCSLAQQAAEKALKGALVLEQSSSRSAMTWTLFATCSRPVGQCELSITTLRN